MPEDKQPAVVGRAVPVQPHSVTQLPEKPVWQKLVDGELTTADTDRNPTRAVPKGPRKAGLAGVTIGPYIPRERRLSVAPEDHPVEDVEVAGESIEVPVEVTEETVEDVGGQVAGAEKSSKEPLFTPPRRQKETTDAPE